MLRNLVARFSTTPTAGQRRAIGLNLVVFFVFALSAVLMLTRTAVAANAINRDVASTIEPAVGDIDRETSHLPVLDTTVKITGQIAAAANPLSGELSGVVDATGSINDSLAVTADSVAGINTAVDGIRTSTAIIRPDVDVLNHHVVGIHDAATGIAERLSTVANQSSSMITNLRAANIALGNILAMTRPLNVQVEAIRGSVPRIDVHARNISGSPLLLRTSNPRSTSQFDLTTYLLNLFGGH